MIDVDKPAPPAWWDDFLQRVRANGGAIGDALKAMDKSHQTHHFHVSRSPALAKQLEEAVEAGRIAAKTAKAQRILAAVAEGESFVRAAQAEDLSAGRAYLLLETVGLKDRYERLRVAMTSGKDYRFATVYLRRKLAADREEYGDNGPALGYLRTIQEILDFVDMDSEQLRATGYSGIRNGVLRIIGQDFDDLDDFPRFLRMEE